jgi:biopolymer transport protein ExbB
MHLTQRILGFTLLGSEWVLWLLIGLSVLSITVMIERAIAFGAGGGNIEALGRELVGRLLAADPAGAQRLLEGRRAPAATVASAGIAELDRGADAVSETMAGAKAHLRVELERHLGILGTLGNNAPFIGLLGTVLGIINAFADLAHNQAGGAAVVMSGISEALVATAIGLIVAIPAVVAFNFFQGKVRKAMAEIDAMAHLVLSTIPSNIPSNIPSSTPSTIPPHPKAS